MNQKTSRLIQRFSGANAGSPHHKPRDIRRSWRKTPWNKRRALRQTMQEELK